MNKSSLILFNKIIEKSEETQTLPWMQGFINEGLPYNYKSGRMYNGQNILMLWCNNYNRSGWLTYKQALELGGQVRKGEHGLPILYAQSGKMVEDEETGEMKSTHPVFRVYTVFNVAQIDNLPELPHDAGNNLKAEDFLSKLPVVMVQGEIPHYNAKRDVIGIPYPSDYDDENAYYSSIFHELMHYTARRTGRKFEDFSSMDRMYEELVAELGNALLRSKFNVKTPKNIPEVETYVSEWITTLKGNPDMLFKAMKDAEKAVNYLIDLTKPEKRETVISYAEIPETTA